MRMSNKCPDIEFFINRQGHDSCRDQKLHRGSAGCPDQDSTVRHKAFRSGQHPRDWRIECASFSLTSSGESVRLDAAAGLEPAASLPIDWKCPCPIAVENRGSIRLSYAAIP